MSSFVFLILHFDSVCMETGLLRTSVDFDGLRSNEESKFMLRGPGGGGYFCCWSPCFVTTLTYLF